MPCPGMTSPQHSTGQLEHMLQAASTSITSVTSLIDNDNPRSLKLGLIVPRIALADILQFPPLSSEGTRPEIATTCPNYYLHHFSPCLSRRQSQAPSAIVGDVLTDSHHMRSPITYCTTQLGFHDDLESLNANTPKLTTAHNTPPFPPSIRCISC